MPDDWLSPLDEGRQWCARSWPHSAERSHPRRASRLVRCDEDQRRFNSWAYAMAASGPAAVVLLELVVLVFQGVLPLIPSALGPTSFRYPLPQHQ